MSQSDTPRTDAVVVVCDGAPGWRHMVDAEFSHTLERELTALRDRLADSIADYAESEKVRNEAVARSLSYATEIVQLKDRLAAAEAALREITSEDCPMPVIDEPSIGACIAAGKCGCVWGNHAAAIASAQKGVKHEG